MYRHIIAFLLFASTITTASAQEKAAEVVLAKDGKALLPVFVAVEALPPPPKKKAGPAHRLEKSVADLRRCLQRMTGADFAFSVGANFPKGEHQPGIYVGTAKDFTWIDCPKDMQGDEFILRTTANGDLLLIGGGEPGMSNAMYALLEKLGCRWYFPGSAWEVIPSRPTAALAANERQKPSVALLRRLPVGHGLHDATIARDYQDWTRRNRMPGILHTFNSHIWPGISVEKDFKTHPEWFAEVNGKRQKSQPCYSHPEVIARGVAQSIAYLDKNPKAQMVSTSAPDGGGFCECERCRALAKVAKIYPAHGPAALFGMREDGLEVSVPSETIFNYVNKVAEAVAAKHPGKLVGMIAYSSYSHPPSFALQPNVYVEVTQGYRRTPLTLSEQMADFAKKAKHLGMYEYYDVEQWSWDQPGRARAAHLDYHASSIPYFQHQNINAITGEVSNNFGPYGVGYYVIARLMWDSSADARALEEDFYQTAFGPAAAPLKRLYRRWESRQTLDARNLGLAYRDMIEAVKLTEGQPAYRARVDQVRMYLHFVKASHFINDISLAGSESYTKGQLNRIAKKEGPDALKQKVEHLGEFVRRLMDTNMVHSYAYNTYLAKAGNMLGCDTKDWRKPGTIPTPAELDEIFQEDVKSFTLDLAALKDVEPRRFSRALVPIKDARPELVKAGGAKIVCEPLSKGSLYLHAKAGDLIAVSLTPTVKAKKATECKASFISEDAFGKGWAVFGGTRMPATKMENGTFLCVAALTGYYYIEWNEAAVTSISHPAVLRDEAEMGLRGATLYFFVPGGTTRFIVQPRVTGGPAFTLRDGAGKTVLDVDKKQAAAGAQQTFVIDVPAGSDNAVWSVAGLRNGYGIANLKLIGVPNHVSFLPEQLLVPRETVR
jgi:hypothetical protein